MLSFLMFVSIPMTANAKVRLDTLKDDTFVNLSDTDKEDTIKAIAEKLAKDLPLSTPPNFYFYSCKEWAAIANYYQGIDYIYFNLGIFNDSEDADAAGETVGYHLVKSIAHEMRHDFQWEHQNDDSDYGRACKINYTSYVDYYNDLNGYNTQFLEQDANQYAIDYANRYFKIRSK